VKPKHAPRKNLRVTVNRSVPPSVNGGKKGAKSNSGPGPRAGSRAE
jgi:hypothetical protein